MSPPTESGPSPAANEKVTFRDVVAYLHGVTDAVHAMQKSCLSVRPGSLETSLAPLGNGDVALLAAESKPPARLTLRHGEAEIEFEGRILVPQTPFPALAGTNGARLIELEGAGDDPNDRNEPLLARGTLPYWAPAVSLAPLRPFAGNTDRPLDLDEQRQAALQHTAYSALALSLVPIAPVIPSGWPEEGAAEERVSGIRLRAAPLSAEFYDLTGTDPLR